MELLVAIDAIDELVWAANPKMLHPEKKRVDEEARRAAIARLRTAMVTTFPDLVAPQLGRARRTPRAHVRGGRSSGRPRQVSLEAVGGELDEARHVAVADIKRQRGL